MYFLGFSSYEQKQQLNETVHQLEDSLKKQGEEMNQLQSSLQSAYNQMASDKEVKYYLDENFTRITQELK